MKAVTFFGIALLAFIVAIGGSAGRVDAALQTYSVLEAPPGIDTASGYPFYYRDFNGLALGFCTNLLACLGAAGNPGVTGFEDFYWIIESPATLPNGAFYRTALEMSTFDDGLGGVDRFVFYRVRFRLDVTVPGDYTLIHPFGSKTYLGVPAGTRAINDTVDLGVIPDDFASVLPVFGGPAVPGFPNGGQFVTWTPDPVLAGPPFNGGFIGIFNIPHAITPGPGGALLEIRGPANAFGTGVSTITESTFHVAGQIQGNAPPQITGSAADNAMLMNRLSNAVVKTINFLDPNGGPLAAITTGLPAFCTADNTVANRVTYSCDPTLATPQGTTPVTLRVTDNTALQDNVTFNVVVQNLAPQIAAIAPTTVLNTSTDNVVIPVTVTDPDNNVIVTLTAAITPAPSDNNWFRFIRTGATTGQIVIDGPIPTVDGNKTYSVDIHATDDGNPTQNGEAAASVQVNNSATIVLQGGGGGGGGCAVAGTTGGGLSEAMGAFGILAILAVALAPLRRKKHHRT